VAQKRNDDPEPEQLPADEKRLEPPTTSRPKAAPLPQEVEQTRVLLTGDNRTVVSEEYVPTSEFGFRIQVNGQWWEHVADAADSGTWIFAPTR